MWDMRVSKTHSLSGMHELARRLLPAGVAARLRTARWLRDRVRHRGEPRLRFRCNICARRTSFALARMGREVTSCGWCGSTVRFRALMIGFASAVLDESRPLAWIPPRRTATGLGFSDPEVYARHLRRLTNYTNSWYHRQPRRDLTDLPSFRGLTYDFLVCSEVLEHIDRPVDPVFKNLYSLLNPGGVLVLSIPTREGQTIEHFPELKGYAVTRDSRGWVLNGIQKDGHAFASRQLSFHGGPGATLEMRIFGRSSVLEALQDAGFAEIEEIVTEDPNTGLVWQGTLESGLPPGVWVAHKPRQ